MTFSRANAGNLRMDTESSLGTAAGSAVYLRPEDVPDIPTMTRQMIANANAGHRNPYDVSAKPQAIEIFRENGIKFGQRIRRANADGVAAIPSLATILKSAGWTRECPTDDATISDVTPSASEFDLDSDVTDEGQAILVARTAGVYVPVLVLGDASGTITPSIALSAAPSNGAVVEIMQCMTPTTATTYQVPTNQTLQFRWNSWAQYDDALGDLSVLCAGCALSSVDAIEIGPVGSFPVFNMSFHVADVDIAANDIAAETFVDSGNFAMITDDFEFAFTNASLSSTPALVSKQIEKLTINLNIQTKPIITIGTGGLNGIGGYMLIPQTPTITFSGYFAGDSTLEKKIIDTLIESTNTSQYIHAIQPTRNLDVPAFGFWAPNCHLTSNDSFNIQMKGDNAIKFEATFECSTGGLGGSLTDIDEVESAPIYFAVSGEVEDA